MPIGIYLKIAQVKPWRLSPEGCWTVALRADAQGFGAEIFLGICLWAGCLSYYKRIPLLITPLHKMVLILCLAGRGDFSIEARDDSLFF